MSDPYDLAPEPVAPELPGLVVIRENEDGAIDALAADLLMQALGCVRSFGDFHFAAAAGPLTGAIYRRLMYDPPMRAFPWKRTRLYVLAEHADDPADPESAFSDIRDWLEHSDIPADQLHAVPVGAPEPAFRYEKTIQEHLGWREPGHDRLDAVLLAPTLSVHRTTPLPASEAGGSGLTGTASSARALNGASSAVGMSERLVNAARFVAVFAPGVRSKPAIDAISRGTPSEPDGALARLQPVGGELRWYLDHDAVGFTPTVGGD